MKSKSRKRRSRENKATLDCDDVIEKLGVFRESVSYLRGRLDEHLKSIEGSRGARSLRAAIGSPARLHGQVKAEK